MSLAAAMKGNFYGEFVSPVLPGQVLLGIRYVTQPWCQNTVFFRPTVRAVVAVYQSAFFFSLRIDKPKLWLSTL